MRVKQSIFISLRPQRVESRPGVSADRPWPKWLLLGSGSCSLPPPACNGADDPNRLSRGSGPSWCATRRNAEKAEVTLGGGVRHRSSCRCVCYSPLSVRAVFVHPVQLSAVLWRQQVSQLHYDPKDLDMIVLLGRRKKAGPCTGKVERRQFCNTNNPAESRRQPSWFSRDGNHARVLQPLPLRHGQPLEFVIVDNADHDRCEDEVRMMHEQIIPQLPRLPGFDQAVHQVDQQDLQGDNKQAEAFRLTQGQRFFTSPHIRTERAACEVPC